MTRPPDDVLTVFTMATEAPGGGRGCHRDVLVTPPTPPTTTSAILVCLLLLLLPSPPSVHAQQQHPCGVTGSVQGQILDCSNLNLDQFPLGIPSDTVDLDLSNNLLTSLPDPDALFLPSLRTLKIQNCLLQSLPRNAFASMPQLQTLILTGNDINQVSVDAFLFNTALESISLNRNKIQTLPANTFNNLDLTLLHLGDNSIQDLPNQAFDGATITNLNLDHNNLDIITKRLFDPLRESLDNLELSDNRQPLAIEADVFADMKFNRIVMRNSGIRDINFLQHVHSVELDLSDTLTMDTQRFINRDRHTIAQKLILRNVNLRRSRSIRGFLANFKEVTHLDLSFNNMISFFPDSLAHLGESLEVLILDHNVLLNIPSDIGLNLPLIRELSLANNSISTVLTVDLSKMTRLKNLNLQNNKIQILDEALQDPLDKIDTLQFSGNPFHCNCEMRWFREWLDMRMSYLGVDDCFSPQKVYIWDLEATDFKCTAPRVTSIGDNVTVPRGGEVFLTCVAQGDPAPHIEWRAPFGEVVSITPPQNRTTYKTSVFWHLSRIEESYAGRYTCVARNMQGTVNSDVYVSVFTKTTPVSSSSSSSSSTTIPSTPTTTITTSSSTTTTTTTAAPPITSTTTAASSSSRSTTSSPESSLSSQTRFSVTPAQENLTESPEDENRTVVIIIAVVVGLVVVIILLIVLICIFLKHKRSRRYDIDTSVEVKHYLYKDSNSPMTSPVSYTTYNGHLPTKTHSNGSVHISSV